MSLGVISSQPGGPYQCRNAGGGKDRKSGEDTKSRNNDNLRPLSNKLTEGFRESEIPAYEHADRT